MKKTIKNLSVMTSSISGSTHIEAIGRYCRLYKGLLSCLHSDLKDHGKELSEKDYQDLGEQANEIERLYNSLNNQVEDIIENNGIGNNLENTIHCLKELKSVQVILKRELMMRTK